MNKIHNNLTIENLVKTEWFNQFNENQKHRIIKGLNDNLDVSVYAKPEYNSKYMATIREGLEDNLDVVFYADYAFSDSQMEQIRKAIKEDKNLLITYGDGSHEFDQKQIEEIKYIAESRYATENKITKDNFLNKQKKRIVSFFNSLKNK